MKYLIVSDIHGSGAAMEKVASVFAAEKPDFLLLLGDVLYHGPRNPLPGGHDPQRVAAILNGFKENIIAVRGNCDSEVDQLLLQFPCMQDYAFLADGSRLLFLTHGHLYPDRTPPFNLKPGSFYFSGHTHIGILEEERGIVYCNPGSVSLPKGENPVPSYALYTDGGVTLRRLADGKEIARLSAAPAR